MAQRPQSWGSSMYGPPRPTGEGYYPYEHDPARPSPTAGPVNIAPDSQSRPVKQEDQTQYHRPEYYYPLEYHQPPSPSYQQQMSHYGNYPPQPEQHPSLLNDPYRSAPMPRYHPADMPREAPAVPPANVKPYDHYEEARQQHHMMRNQLPPMPTAPRVPNANYAEKVAIPFTPPHLQISAVRPGSTVRGSAGPGPSSATASAHSDRGVKIEDLLSGGGSEAANAAPPNEYEIFFRQQPVAARCCGYGERDRRVIDPPPIVQLKINNPDLSPDEMYAKLHHPAYVVHCSIWDKDGNKDETDMPSEFVRPGKRLMGSLVSSPFVGQDEHGNEGCFFCFPDMSVRTPGPFRLRFSLVYVDHTHRSLRAPIKCTIMSDIFNVYNAKDFPGMQASTPLTKRLKEQGCLISIKKGNEKSGGKSSRRQDDSDEDEEEGESSSKRKKSKKQR